MLWHEGGRLDVKRAVSDDHLRSLIVVLAHEFETLAGRKPQVETAVPGRCVRAGIVDDDLVLDRIEIRAREFFDHVELFGGGNSEVVDPHALVETPRVYNERVAFPMSDGVPAVRGR